MFKSDNKELAILLEQIVKIVVYHVTNRKNLSNINKHPNRGQKRSEETKEKIRQTKIKNLNNRNTMEGTK